MSFEPVRCAHGQPRTCCTCRVCGREEVIAASRGRIGRDANGAAATKIQMMGWSYIGKRLRCPACEAKRKVTNMASRKSKTSNRTSKPPGKAITPSSPREPTFVQKRAILDLLNECYDTDDGCYCQGDTDETIADVLKVMPGWVIQLREEFYGPAGSNEEMFALAADLKVFLEFARPSLQAHQKRTAAMLATIEKAEGFLQRIASIEKAVGPRVMAQVK